MSPSSPGTRAERGSSTSAHFIGALRATVAAQGDSVLEPFMLTAVLRWADRQDAEAEAIAAFNGEEYAALLPSDLRWASYKDAPRPLTTSEVDQLWGKLSRSLGLPSQVGNGAHDSTSGLLTESGAAAWAALLHDAVPWADALDLDSLAGRRAARDEVTQLASSVLARYQEDLTTPSELSRLMVEFAGPTPGDRVYDPCCGTGGLLAEAADALWQRGRRVSAAEWSKASRVPLFGVEVRPATHAVALVRLLLSGVAPALEIGDALEREAAGRHHDQGFDCVLVDPPMGMTVGGPDLYDFPIRSRRSESLFVQHALRSLRAGGRAVIAVPEVLLWSGGREAELREWLLKDFRLEAVIGLPRGRRAARRVPQSLLVVQRAAPAKEVAFVQLERLPESGAAARGIAERVLGRSAASQTEAASGAAAGSTSGSRSGARSTSSSSSSSGPRTSSTSPAGPPVHRVPLKDLLSQGSELRVPAAEEDALWTALDELRSEVELVEIASICEVVSGHPVPSRDTAESGEPGNLPVIRIGDIGGPKIVLGEKHLRAEAAPGVPGPRLVRRGDLLLSVKGTIGKTHYVAEVDHGSSVNPNFARLKEEGGFAVAQQGLIILRPDARRLDARFLAALLASATYQGKLRAGARGAFISNLPIRVLKQLVVPVPPPAIQQRVLARLADRPGDGLEALLLVLEGKDVDPITQLLRENPAVDLLTREGVPAGKELERAALDALRALRPIRNQAAHGHVDMPVELLAWLIAVGSLPIMSVRESKNGFRYEALTASHALLESAVARAGQLDGLTGKRARRLSERLRQWVGHELESAASDYEIDAYVISADEPDDTEHMELTIDIALAGRAFLTDVEIECDDGIGGFTSVRHLDAEQPVSLQVGYDTEDLAEVSPDHHEFRGTVKVSGVRPDGLRVEHAIPFDHPFFGVGRQPVAPAAPEPVWEDYGNSPYNAGDVVDDPAMFFGRREILDAIRTHLGGGTKVILVGPGVPF